MRFVVSVIIEHSSHDIYGGSKGLTLAKGSVDCFCLLKDILIRLFSPQYVARCYILADEEKC